MIAFLRPWLLLSLLVLIPAILVFRRGRGRSGVLALRLSALFFLGLATAGPRITAPSDRVNTVFVLDVSDSMGRQGSDGGLAAVNRLLEGMRGDDQAALVTVATTAAVEAPSSSGGAPFRRNLQHNSGNSRLADGIYAGVGALPSDGGEGRIVLVSDGRDGGGDLETAAAFAAEAGIIVDVLPAGPASAAEALVESLSVPETITEDEIHSLTAVIHSSGPLTGRLFIALNGEYIGEDNLRLSPGTHRRTYQMPGLSVGEHAYEVVLDSAGDHSPENNRGLALATVEGTPRILWVGRGESAVPRALEAQGRIVDRMEPEGLPDSIRGYAAWNAVILDNVSAREFSLRSLDLLETWVRTRGGGLMMIGGDASFGLGGWQETPVEEALPVDMDAPSSLYIPSLTMVMVIDKSGSMGAAVDDDFNKLDIVKDAVLGAVGLLNPLFSLGLLAFDADWEWTIPVTEAGKVGEIRSGLEGLESGGGTVLYPAIKEAYEALSASPSAHRHLVILSDGLSEPADYDTLALAIARDGITVSTVVVGSDGDDELMTRIAEIGGGHFWYAEDATQVPRIFASESMIVSRGLAVNETVFPRPAMKAEALSGVELDFMPPLHGYVMAYPNPTAVEALRSPRSHPILVYGTHGLGRSVAFTSDLRGGWGRDWARWDQLPRLLAQSVRWMTAGPGGADMEFTMSESGGEVLMRLEARTPEGGFRTELRPEGTVVGPDQRDFQVAMTQTEPGLYEGRFRPRTDGIYSGSVGDEAAGVMMDAHWSRSYPAELRRRGIDTAAVAAAARSGGGRLLNTGTLDVREWWSVRNPAERTLMDLSLILAVAALILFLVDIAIRESANWRQKDMTGGKRSRGPAPDMEALMLQGLDAERHKPKFRRPTPAEAARLLAERRQRRERRQG